MDFCLGNKFDFESVVVFMVWIVGEIDDVLLF